MSATITQIMVFDYIANNPGSTPLDIADGLNAPIYKVKTKLMKLMNKKNIYRNMNESRLSSMFYYPNTRQKILI